MQRESLASYARESWEPDLGNPRWWVRLLSFAGLFGGAIGLIGFISGDLLICLFDWTGLVVLGTALAAAMSLPVYAALKQGDAAPSKDDLELDRLDAAARN